MAPSTKRSPVYLWVELSEMEKTVWAVTYAIATRTSHQRARKADEAVRSLRSLERPVTTSRNPEHEAARANIDIPLSTFTTWYRVQIEIQRGSSFRFKPPSDEECADAYERYHRGRGDFY